MEIKKYFFYSFVLALFLFSCQNKNILKEIENDVLYLSDDKLEGRETGTKGEDLAAEYIVKRFDKIGLQTKVDTFEFNDNVEVNFICDISNLYPTKYSNSSEALNLSVVDVNFGIHAPSENYSDYKNIEVKDKAVLINTSSPDGIHPHSKYVKYHSIVSRIEEAKKRGVKCIIFFNQDKNAESLAKKFKKLKNTGLPVLFLKDSKDKVLNQKITFSLQIKEQKLKGKNIIANINNNAIETVIIGAHYDHIGWGKEGSRYIGEPAIHNGADDNASGVAALFQLAKILKKQKESYNYTLIAFSGEEKGLLGSNAYLKEQNLNKANINCMINLDMIGRLDTSNTLQIFGTGTSPSWNNLIDSNNTDSYFNIKKSKSGIGPSDHTSFYLHDIPVLHFFTGAHDDYHKPQDDADKINYKGLEKIIYYIEKIVSDVAASEPLKFSKTNDENSKSVPKFSVTLGVVPDYLFEKRGMRIDGVSPNRPAYNAGIKKGDIIVGLGKYEIEDIYSYMKALSAFNKKDSTNATILRGKKELSVRIIF